MSLNSSDETVLLLAPPSLGRSFLSASDRAVMSRLHSLAEERAALQRLYAVLAAVLGAGGLVGGCLAMAIMIRSRQMRSPSFTYHKALLGTNLIYCGNSLLLQALDKVGSVGEGQGQLVFRYWAAAFYSGCLSRLISSTCGYLVLYLTSTLALDRCLALCRPFHYHHFNRHPVSTAGTFAAVLAATVLNSWSAPWQRRLVAKTLGNSTVYTWRSRQPPFPAALLTAKDVLNAATRVTYPILLSVLTALATLKFYRQQRLKKSLTSAPSPARGRKVRSSERKFKSLFYLMLAVVALAFVQVIPREILRLVTLVSPKAELWAFVDNSTFPLPLRLKALSSLRLHWLLQITSNVATMVERSLTFYVYLAFNPAFRRETLRNLFVPKCIGLNIHVTGDSTTFQPTSALIPTTFSPTRDFCSSNGFSPQRSKGLSRASTRAVRSACQSPLLHEAPMTTRPSAPLELPRSLAHSASVTVMEASKGGSVML